MKNILKYILGIFIVIVPLIIIKNYMIARLPDTTEGFGNNDHDNKEKYTYKRDELFDDFYARIYDELNRDINKNNYEIDEVVKFIRDQGADLKNKNALDIGSATGHHVDLLNKKGIKCVGLDKSEAMIKKAHQLFPKYNFKHGDVMKTMTINKNSLSLITCLYFTIYYIKDKSQFFQNCMHWLKPGGYLVVHLVNKDKFSPLIPAGDPFIMISPQNYTDKRITESVVSFNNFKYKANFDLKGGKGIFKETIKFKNNNKVRQNEHLLYMETQLQILSMAKDVGFQLKDKISLGKVGYDFQYLYVLYKPK